MIPAVVNYFDDNALITDSLCTEQHLQFKRYSAGIQNNNSPDGLVNHLSIRVALESTTESSPALSEEIKRVEFTSQTLMVPPLEPETRDAPQGVKLNIPQSTWYQKC